jgi:hypothetical protein
MEKLDMPKQKAQLVTVKGKTRILSEARTVNVIAAAKVRVD